MKQLNRDEWLTEIPQLIYKLKKDYNFYYSGFRVKITKDILDIIKNKKHKHKIVLYSNEANKFFLVVYRKNDAVIYYTNEYKNDSKYNRIKYFINKFNNAYNKAKKELEDEFFSNN